MKKCRCICRSRTTRLALMLLQLPCFQPMQKILTNLHFILFVDLFSTPRLEAKGTSNVGPHTTATCRPRRTMTSAAVRAFPVPSSSSSSLASPLCLPSLPQSFIPPNIPPQFVSRIPRRFCTNRTGQWRLSNRIIPSRWGRSGV
jgi:hypothetical protein